MRLATIARAPAWGELSAFSRLDPTSRSPICVAVSGGGDSVAALIHACAWAKAAGRPVLALSVDHGLQPASAAWSAFAGDTAARLGARFQALTWKGEKPATGLPAAARQARHRLLADAARAAGASVVVTGHTADDQIENAALGQGVLREWSPSPVWPDGRGVFLLRPLLAIRRAAIRHDIVADGWNWIDDPANEDPRYPRARLRLSSPMRGGAGDGESAQSSQRWTGAGDFITSDRELTSPLPTLSPQGGEGHLRFPRSIGARALAFAAVCVGGGSRLPRSAEVERILGRLRNGELFVATLCGSRIEATDEMVFTREAGRSGLQTLRLPVGEAVVWDGRYELRAEAESLTVKALAGHASKLAPSEAAALRRIDARARGALPLIERAGGTVSCPVLAGNNAVRVRALVRERYLSGFGAIQTEPQACDVLCMAN